MGTWKKTAVRAPVPRSDVRLFVCPVWQEGHSRSYPRPLWLRILVFLVSLGARRPAAGAGSWEQGAGSSENPSIHTSFLRPTRTDSRAASGDPPGITQRTTLLSMCVLIGRWMHTHVFGTWYLGLGTWDLKRWSSLVRENDQALLHPVNRDGVLGAVCTT